MDICTDPKLNSRTSVHLNVRGILIHSQSRLEPEILTTLIASLETIDVRDIIYLHFNAYKYSPHTCNVIDRPVYYFRIVL
jgi:hypothetical protein